MNQSAKKQNLFKKIFGKKSSFANQTTTFDNPQNFVIQDNLNNINENIESNFEIDNNLNNLNQMESFDNPIDEFVPQVFDGYDENSQWDFKNNINDIDEKINYFEHNDDFFKTPGRIIHNKEESPINIYGIPSDIRYDHKKVVEKNLSFKNLYTKKDIEKFELSESMFIKFYKNGSIFYKLKNEFDTKNFDIYSIFKLDTTFSKIDEFEKSSISELDDKEEKEIKINLENKFVEKDNNDLLNENENNAIVLFDSWKENPFNSAIDIESEEEWKRNDLRSKIFKLNQEIESKISNYKKSMIGKTDEEKKELDLNQQKVRDFISETNQAFPTEQILFKIQGLVFLNYEESNIYYGYKLENINFDVYPSDRIVVISDDSVTNQLLIDVLRGDETKTSGYVYRNFSNKNQWIDVLSIEASDAEGENTEITNELASPDYLSFLTKKKEKVVSAMKKIFKKLDKEPSALFVSELAEKMCFSDYLTKNIFALDDLMLEKFITMCDILIGKKVILMKSICQDMSIEKRNQLLTFLDNYFKNKNITAIYATEDINDVNLIGNKIMVLKQGQLMDIMSNKKIVEKFESLNDFVNYYLTYGITNNNF